MFSFGSASDNAEPSPHAGPGRGAFARERGGQRKYLGPKNGLLRVSLRDRHSHLPTEEYHDDKLKLANAFGREGKTGDEVRPFHRIANSCFIVIDSAG
jgi:hypothetical protein